MYIKQINELLKYFKEKEIVTLEEYNQTIHEILNTITTIEVDNIIYYLDKYKDCKKAGINIK